MPIRVKGLQEVKDALERAKTEVPKRVQAAFVESTDDMQKRSQELAPVDKGNLEDAIKITPLRQVTPTRVRRTLYIDDHFAKVGEYAAFIHEGDYKLGPKSLAKAAAIGAHVGPKFLTRGVRELVPALLENIAQAMDLGHKYFVGKASGRVKSR